MRTIIHIGTEKTGSTSIQDFFHINRNLFRRHGVLYPLSPGQRNHRALPALCMNTDQNDDYTRKMGIISAEKRSYWSKKCQDDFNAEIESAAGLCHTILLTSEHFHSRLQSRKEVMRVRELAPDPDNIEVIVYLRRQDELAVSQYSTICRTGGRRSSIIPTNVGQDNHYYNYLNLIDLWSDVFGIDSVAVRIFVSSELKQGDIITDFLFATGIKHPQGAKKPCVTNESLSALAQLAAIALNNSTKYTKSGRLDVARRRAIEAIANELKGPPLLPTRQEALSFYRLFEPSNNELAQKQLGRNQLFEPDFSRYPETTATPNISPSDLEIIIKAILTMSPELTSGS